MLYNTWCNARLTFPNDTRTCPTAIKILILSCWESIPENRPTAAEVQSELCDILASIKAGPSSYGRPSALGEAAADSEPFASDEEGLS